MFLSVVILIFGSGVPCVFSESFLDSGPSCSCPVHSSPGGSEIGSLECDTCFEYYTYNSNETDSLTFVNDELWVQLVSYGNAQEAWVLGKCAGAPCNTSVENAPENCSTHHEHHHEIVKRNVIQFGNMIKCATGKPSGDYNGYGCWCGKGGSGVPVDATDTCCKVHDACYANIQKLNICPLDVHVYTVIYKWNDACPNPTCAPAGAYGWWYKCFYASVNCRVKLCDCDQKAVMCFKANLGTFNRAFVNYDKKRFCKPVGPG